MIVKRLHDSGIRSEHAYAAAFASIGLSVITWATSLKAEKDQGLDRADRWGLYVSEWPHLPRPRPRPRQLRKEPLTRPRQREPR